MNLRASSLPIALGLSILILGGAGLYILTNRDAASETATSTPTPSSATSPLVSVSPTIESSATPSASASPTTSPAAASKTVTMTNSGFTPSTVTIAVGDTVTFMNNSTMGMWVGSDPHPSHTDYSAFDARTSITPGRSWSFTFTKTGTWMYHNHLDDSATGTIIVK